MKKNTIIILLTIYLPFIFLQNQYEGNKQSNLKISYSENLNKVLIPMTKTNKTHVTLPSEDFNDLSRVIGASQIAIGLILLSFTLNKKKVSIIYEE